MATTAEQSKAYHRTPRGYLHYAYRNAKNRVTGKTNRPRYIGLPIMERDAFLEWGMSNPDFHRLFAAWLEAGCPRRLAPSVDRIDPTRGYELDNIRYLPLYLNRPTPKKRAA
jgi:hypothetical protein